ncbi:ABC transporter ATP-binding protein [Nocardia panacis]|uniref:ABC transporter ATP-binding protein n=1 Tax=Nocardia panacis TaxID=2340916 RepID=A0A3A4KD58_9NOCA|nr:ABC transporter ATP-binding protein [Nocardia panacis]RJO80018.1 ABC transporter ATP-binding protein [Nocardia panacis]
MNAQKTPALAARGLTKHFGPVAAVRGIDLTVSAGTVAALIGPFGAGKSTVLRLLLGLSQPTSGTVELHGPARGMLAPRGLHPGLTARDHLRGYAAAVRLPDERVDQVLGLVGLEERAAARIKMLAPGERTRLALATVLLDDPRVLLLDEPFDGLDPTERARLHDLLRRHARRGGSALLTGESLAAALPAADQVIVLSAGTVTYQGTPTRLRRNHPDRLVVAASTPIALATMLAARGYTDAVMRPDGRLAIAEASEAQIRDAAIAAGVRIDAILADPIHPDRVLAGLTKTAVPSAIPAGVAPPQPYGIPR